MDNMTTDGIAFGQTSTNGQTTHYQHELGMRNNFV